MILNGQNFIFKKKLDENGLRKYLNIFLNYYYDMDTNDRKTIEDIMNHIPEGI